MKELKDPYIQTSRKQEIETRNLKDQNPTIFFVLAFDDTNNGGNKV